MLTSVLIPHDGSEFSDRVLPVVHRLLLAEEVAVDFLHVALVLEADDEISPEVLGRIRTYLEERAQKLEKEGLEAAVNIRRGDPAEEILSYIRETRPSLVAMSTLGATGLRRFIRGSVAERVMRESPVPLLLVNPETAEKFKGEDPTTSGFERIMVPLDGSDRSARIIPLVTHFARLYDAKVDLVFVSGVPVQSHSELEQLGEIPPGEDVPFLEPYAESLERSGVDVKIHQAFGPPASQILDMLQVTGADLLAMTTHGRQGLSRWLLGSVAENVLRHCTTPLLLKRTVK